MTQDFFLIGGQSNVGTSSLPFNLHSDLGYLKTDMPAELTGEQLNVKVWNGTEFINFTPKPSAQYGWINFLLHDIGQAGKVISFYKFGIGGIQLNRKGPNPIFPRQPLEKNGLQAWNYFKANNENSRLIFLWCQGFSDGLQLDISMDYGAQETTHLDHNSGGVLGEYFNRIRRIFEVPTMHVIYNTLSNNATGSTYRENVKAGQLHASLSNYNNIVDADNLTMLDSAHFDLQGNIDLADRYLTVYNNL